MDAVTAILFVCGFVLLTVGAEFLVRGASRLAVLVGISPLVVGLTVVAYGTSAPELAVALQASYDGQADIAIGNVIGSNISNILLILGGMATIAPLGVSRKLVRQEIPLMILLSFLVLLMGLDGKLGHVDGSILFIGAIVYTVWALLQSRRKNQAKGGASAAHSLSLSSWEGLRRLILQLGLIVLGLGLLVLGSRWLVGGAVAVAEMLNVSQLIIALTIIAVGTSLPEIATSIASSFHDSRDLAVGNAVGSNLFNILMVLGLCSAIAPDGIPMSAPVLRFDLPVMIAVAMACMPIFFSGYRIARWEGLLFLLYYVAYTMYLFLNATEHAALGAFKAVMLAFVVPLTAITLVTVAFQTWHGNRRDKSV